MNEKLRRAELVAAILLTGIAVLLNVVAAVSAGPLWRDEANTVGLASLPTFREVWSNLQYDSFPILWIGFIRALGTIAGEMNDTAFRVAGLLVGLFLIAAIWINARGFRLSYPLLSLALLALSPSVIRWGTSLRAYGLGMAASVLTCLAIWRYIEKPRPRNFLLAALAATASVHILFYNAPVVFALSAAGIVVATVKRDWRTAAGVLAAGAIAAVTLLIYIPTITAAASWNPLVRIPDYDLRWFLYKLNQTFHAGAWLTIVWLFLVLLAAAAAARELSRSARLPQDLRFPTLYAAVALVIGSLAQYAFLKQLSYLTQPWYYLTLIGLSAICVDIVFGKLSAVPVLRLLRLGMALMIAGFTLPSAVSLAQNRMTNVDKVAAFIEEHGRPEDRVVIEPWYIGISFDRYYRGSTPWMMLPSIGFSRFHRYDRVMSFMVEADQNQPAQPAIDGALATLRNGGTVYLVSENRFGEGKPVRLRPPAVMPEDGWKSAAFQTQWSGLFRHAIRRHARSIVAFEPEVSSRVSWFEELNVTVIKGWQD